MAAERICAECGVPLPENAPGNRCPKCLLSLALEETGNHDGPEKSSASTAEKPEPPNDPNSPDEQIGTAIGRYRLLQQIGEGGFGIVFMAEQTEPVQRKVALKVIKAGMDSREIIARFEAERQALALMDHPNIARVLDGGTTASRRPYFVMELVRGIPITEYCDQGRLSTRERLGLFVKVCRAVQHAHQKGVIHRDLKPGNVLVTLHDGQPVPKVIDFGVAKALGQKLTEKTLFTRFEQMIGTPAYMSPEQAALGGLDIDTRADIYSLGVLLYELLTGVTPLDAETLRKGALDEVCRMIRETDPPKPSTRLQSMGGRLAEVARCRQAEPAILSRLVRGDLDWITMKCLDKDRQRRYETVNGLTRDIERHLDNETVVARPPSRAYRFQKLVRRNKLAFGAGALVFLVLVIGVVASTREAIRARQAEQEQTRLRQQAQSAQANEARQRKKAQTEASKSQQVAQFLKNMLAGVGPSVAQGRDTTLLSEILDKTAERVQIDLKDQPEVQGDLNSTLSLTYRDLRDYQKAEITQQRAVEQYTAAFGSEHCKLALALGHLGYIQTRAGKARLGRDTARAGLEMARKCGDKKTLASCLFNMGVALDPARAVTEAEPYVREAVSLQRELGNDPVDLAASLRWLGYCVTELNTSEQLLREARDLYRQCQGYDSLGVARCTEGLAGCLLAEGRSAEAKRAAWEAVKIGRKILKKDHGDLSQSLNLLSHVLIVRGEWNEAESVVRQAVEDTPQLAEAWGRLGHFEGRRQAWAAAAQDFAHAIELEDPTDTAWWGSLAISLLESGNLYDYRQHCHRFLQRFGTGDWCSLFSPVAVDRTDFERACELADLTATASEEPEVTRRWYALGKALADYRRERFRSAAEWAGSAASTGPVDVPCKAAGLFLQAMAFSRLGYVDLASAALSAGNQVVMSNHPDPLDFGEWPETWAQADLLCSEAQGLIPVGVGNLGKSR
jgi:serine/threonine protein kinase/tetratricopeptide (TPR) repeat protein